MSTQKQIKANRQNAQKSTGPKTDEGKAAVSQNAVKHGIFAQSVIKVENEADYEAFHDIMVAELKPIGPTEILLAERIVSLWWRLKRAERIQNQAIDVMIERDEPSPLVKSLQTWMPKDIGPDTRGAGPELVLGRAIIKDYSISRVLDRLILYERRIENSLHKTMRELERQKLIRQYQQQEEEQEFEPSMREKAATQNTTVEKNGNLKKQTQFIRSECCVQRAAGMDLKKQSVRQAKLVRFSRYNPARPKSADRPECKRAYQEVTNGTKPRTQRMVSRNASEGSKPRNFYHRNGLGVALL